MWKSQVIRSRKDKIYHQVKIYRQVKCFLQQSFRSSSILYCWLQLCNNSGFVATSGVMMLFCPLLDDLIVCRIGMVRQGTWSYSTWFGKCSIHYAYKQFFLRCFTDPIRVPRIENEVPRIREKYHRICRIRDIRSLQRQTGYLTFCLKKP